MTTDIMDAEHPGERHADDEVSGAERDRERYDSEVRYAARLYVEAAQDHAAVRDALLNETSISPAIRKHDPDRHEEIHALGLTSFQRLAAETVAQRHLEG